MELRGQPDLALAAASRSADAVDAALVEARDRAHVERSALDALAAAVESHLPAVAADLEQVGRAKGRWGGSERADLEQVGRAGGDGGAARGVPTLGG